MECFALLYLTGLFDFALLCFALIKETSLKRIEEGFLSDEETRRVELNGKRREIGVIGTGWLE